MELQNHINEFLTIMNEWEEKFKSLAYPEKITQRESHPKYYTVEYQQACNQIMNDLGELFFSEGRVNLEEIEKIVLLNLDEKFTRLKVADLAGVSVRTIRNKLNERI